MSEITGRLEDWYVHQVTDKEFIIWGRCYDDVRRRFRQGERIHTSSIKNKDYKEGDIVTTRNSKYKLGKRLRIK